MVVKQTQGGKPTDISSMNYSDSFNIEYRLRVNRKTLNA